jgi:hypothetical protein
MIPRLRHDFNQRFRPEVYRKMLHSLDACTRTHVKLPIAETPCFFPKALLEEMAATGADAIQKLVRNDELLRVSRRAIPPQCRVADETPHPHFAAADFFLLQETDGKAARKLADLHAGPLTFGFQFVLNEVYRSAFELDSALGHLLGGHTESSFWKLMERVVLRGHQPEHVVLAGTNLQNRGLFPDVQVIAERLGVEVAELASLEPEGTRLYYRRGGARIPIYRIYSYFHPAEIGCGQIELLFDPADSYDVEWAGHPNWCFHLGGSQDKQRAKTECEDSAVVIEAPHGKLKPEVRILYLWPEAGRLEAVLPQLRLVPAGKKPMISAAFYSP